MPQKTVCRYLQHINTGELNPLPEAVQKRETYSASVAPGQLTSKQLSQILGYEDSSEEDLLFQRDSRAVYDSCSWICEKEAYQQWREPDNLPKVQYLWLKGQPGTGKSVLMSSVVDQLQDDNQLCVYYFFRENSAAKRTTRSFLLSTLAQWWPVYQSFTITWLRWTKTMRRFNRCRRDFSGRSCS